MKDNNSKGLHLIVMDKNKQVVDVAKDGELILNKETDYVFYIAIKEHQEQLDLLEEEKKQIEAQYQRLHDRYPIETEKATDQANQKVRNNKLKEIEQRITALNTQFNDVVYLWQLVGKSLTATKEDYNKAVGTGYNGPFTIWLKEHVRGGGKAYFEAFYKDQDPKLSSTNGIYVSSFDEPEISHIAWSDHQNNPITGCVKDGSYVFLHIYTKNLYGQEIKIQLMDYDTLKDDKLSNQNEAKTVLYETVAEVNLYEATGLDKDSPALGGLIDVKDQTHAIINVQKAVVRVQVDPLVRTAGMFWGTNSTSKWKSEAGTNLEIYPIITCPECYAYKEFSMKGNYLKVDYDKQDAPSYDVPNYRTPIKTGQVATNISDFHPCGYNTITLSDEDREWVIMFDKNNQPLRKKFEIIAGSQIKEVTIDLDSTASTNDCTAKGTNGKQHKGNVFTIDNLTVLNPTSAADKADEKSKWSAKTEVEIESKSVASKNTGNHSFSNPKTGVFVSDTKAVLKLNYNYNTSPIDMLGIVGLPSILRYIWIGENFATDTYAVTVSSCRYLSQKFDIVVYPDVSWALFFAYELEEDTVSKTKEIVSNQTYKDTNNALFRREEAKWITVGDKKLGIHLVAKTNGNGDEAQNETDVSKDVTEVFKKMLEPVNAALNLFKKIFMGDNNAADGSNADTTQARNAVDQINQNVSNDPSKEKKREELKKLWNNFDNNVARQRSGDEATRKKAEKNAKTLQRKLDKSDLMETRSTLKVEITTPQFAVGVDWRRVPISNPQFADLMNRTGMIVQGTIIFDPIFEVAIVLDFLALAQRAHPLVLALIAALDIALKLTGDGSEMTLDLKVTGTVGGKFTGFLNTLTGENTFTAKDKNSREDAFAELNGELEFEIKANIKIKIEKKVVIILVGDRTVTVKVEAGIQANAKFSGKATLDFDSQGLFIQPEGGFDGLKFQGQASAEGEIRDSKGRGVNSKIGGSISYQAIDKQDPVKLPKIYCLRNK